MPLPTISDRDGTRLITLNRPEKMNAITREDVDVLVHAFGILPPEIRAIALTGSGDRAFSSGMDLACFQDLDAISGRAIVSAIGAMLETAMRAPVPTICAINGYCMGGALELALACDMRVAATTASFGMPEIRLGFPSILYARQLERHVGLTKAREMLLTGELYAVSTFGNCGLLNAVVAQELLLKTAYDFLERISAHSRAAIASQKRLFEIWQNTGLSESVEHSIDEFSLICRQASEGGSTFQG